ncbi:MAG: glycosyltransferase [Kiritimatiellia bacterium]|nr:glycosyltransferase [Lentisphaerota bacterium]
MDFMKKIDSLSVVVPVYNEEASLPELIRRTLAACRVLQRPFELVLVDDGSRDRSPEIIAQAARDNPGAILGIMLNRNYGQHSAVMAGFKHVTGEIVVTLDADLQNPPEEIAKLVACMDEGMDVVGSVRVPRCDSVFRRVSSYMVNRLTARVTGVVMHDYGCMLRAYRRNIVQAMLQCHERSTFIPALANSFAKRTAEVEVRHAQRQGGVSKYSLLKLINLQFDLLTSITTMPLRCLSVFGMLMFLLGGGLGALILVLRVWHGPEWAVDGVFTLLAILFFFLGAQFLAMGLLGEYLGRTYQDVRARPRYFIKDILGDSLLHQAPACPPGQQNDAL